MNVEKSNNKFEKIADLLEAFLENKFENFIDLHDFMEIHIGKVSKDLDDKYREVDEIDDIEEWELQTSILEEELGYEGFKFDHEFPNRIRFYLIVQTYSMLEVYLKWICERLRKIKQNPFSIMDMKGSSDLERAKLYLNKLYNFNISSINPEWIFLNDMRKIRNQIIHNNGEFQLRDKEIIKIIEKTEFLGRMWDDINPKVNPDTIYEIKINSKELNIKFINNVKSFLSKILVEIKLLEENKNI